MAITDDVKKSPTNVRIGSRFVLIVALMYLYVSILLMRTLVVDGNRAADGRTASTLTNLVSAA